MMGPLVALLFSPSAAVVCVPGAEDLFLVRPIIRKLQVDSEIMLPQHRDYFL